MTQKETENDREEAGRTKPDIKNISVLSHFRLARMRSVIDSCLSPALLSSFSVCCRDACAPCFAQCSPTAGMTSPHVMWPLLTAAVHVGWGWGWGLLHGWGWVLRLWHRNEKWCNQLGCVCVCVHCLKWMWANVSQQIEHYKAGAHTNLFHCFICAPWKESVLRHKKVDE